MPSAARPHRASGSLDRPPAARSSVAARSASAWAPQRRARESASSNGPRASDRRLARRSAAPRSVSARACSSRAGERREDIDRLPEPVHGRSTLDQRGGAQRDADAAGRAPATAPGPGRRGPWRRASSLSPSAAAASAARERQREASGFAPPHSSSRRPNSNRSSRPCRVRPCAMRNRPRASRRSLNAMPGGISSPSPLVAKAASAASISPSSSSASMSRPSAYARPRWMSCAVSSSSAVQASVSARATSPRRRDTQPRNSMTNACAGIEARSRASASARSRHALATSRASVASRPTRSR